MSCTSPEQEQQKKHPYVIHDQQLEIVTETKYLGITISNNLSWNNHINNIEASANQAQGMLRRNIKKAPQWLLIL